MKEQETKKSGTQDFVAFIRGMAIFKSRRILLAEQEQVLRTFLPEQVKFKGAFQKTGNYAFSSELEEKEVASALVSALRHHEKLKAIEEAEIFVIQSESVRSAYHMILTKLGNEYGERFSPNTCGVQFSNMVWRAGMTILQEPIAMSSSLWPDTKNPRVMILGASGRIVFFLKREEQHGKESRISFGDPTAAIDQVLAGTTGKALASTSRSLTTVRGILLYAS